MTAVPAITITTGDSGKVSPGSGDRCSTATCRSCMAACFHRPRRLIPNGCPASWVCSARTARSAYATDVRITETNDPQGRPRQVTIRARGPALNVSLQFDVASSVTTQSTQGPIANGVDFLQLRGQVHGERAGRPAGHWLHGSGDSRNVQGSTLDEAQPRYNLSPSLSRLHYPLHPRTATPRVLAVAEGHRPRR